MAASSRFVVVDGIRFRVFKDDRGRERRIKVGPASEPEPKDKDAAPASTAPAREGSPPSPAPASSSSSPAEEDDDDAAERSTEGAGSSGSAAFLLVGAGVLAAGVAGVVVWLYARGRLAELGGTTGSAEAERPGNPVQLRAV
jgi:hypothetical protein